MTRALTPRQAHALGVLFTAKMQARASGICKLPVQVARPLAALGFVIEDSETIPFVGRLTMTVTGYRLTLAGHHAYCIWAAEQPSEEDEP